jgi:ElaB/YqjD/DUF883 family membrane-anchored ribosome-binding protein
MERNDAGTDGLAQGSQSDANEFSGSGATQPNGLDKQAGSFAFGSTPESEAMRDRARQAVGTAGEKLADVGSTVRDKAGIAKDKVANALESGAARLRERAHGGAALAGAVADGSTAIQGDGRVAQVSDRVAGGMQATADWIREADIDGIKSGIEQQVKDHPGRTLLIAAGLGYLIGRAFRNGNQ